MHSTDTPAKVMPKTLRTSVVEHFTGARRTRITYRATVILTDDTHLPCGHEFHPTRQHALKCAARQADRMAAA